MNKSRKYTADLLSNIKFLKNKYENIKGEIVRLTSETEYQQITQHYDQLIEKLNKELVSLPVG